MSDLARSFISGGGLNSFQPFLLHYHEEPCISKETGFFFFYFVKKALSITINVMTYKKIMLVDKDDNFISEAEKKWVHEHGLLHRAFSLLVYRHTPLGYEFLLQKRAQCKYHCAGLWSNTCCSHPTLTGDIKNEAKERLHFEMGLEPIKNDIEFIDKFTYKAVLSNTLIEHEIDHVFIHKYANEDINPNPQEVQAHKWVNVQKLKENIDLNPEKYTPWLLHVIKLVEKNIK